MSSKYERDLADSNYAKLTIYHSNQLDAQKEMLLKLIELNPLSDPFQGETILVQSPGMAQWLQIHIAEKLGIAANFHFPMPASFIWQQYRANLPEVSEHTPFNKEAMSWRLMSLIQQSEFQPLLQYFKMSPQAEQHKRYQLAYKIADLFDQYLVYRPDWIRYWEQGDDQRIVQEIAAQQGGLNPQIAQHIHWQGELWRALAADIEQDLGAVLHRADLHQRYLQHLATHKPAGLPERLFIFGISALPKSYLQTLYAISRHCYVHIFFNNPSAYYWGDIVDPRYLERWQLRWREDWHNKQPVALFSEQQLAECRALDFHEGGENETLLVGNDLLASWGKLGRDFLYMLTELEANEISAYIEPEGDTLLAQLQRNILWLNNDPVDFRAGDRSVSLHACHSAMREVEVLHDHLLALFEQDPSLTPKDIVVMAADIDRYTPYIHAVFGQYQDNRAIPYSLSDGKLTENDVLVSGFLSLFSLPEREFQGEELLALLDIPAVQRRFAIEAGESERLRAWVHDSGIRFGLSQQDVTDPNYNAWQPGIERMLLGAAMREADGIWQARVGFDPAYGLKGELVGKLAAFIDALSRWQQYLQQGHRIQDWRVFLTDFLAAFFAEDGQNQESLLYIRAAIDELAELLTEIGFEEAVEAQVIAEVLAEKLAANSQSLRFLAGKVSFCTLLPMRAIPFKVVCLLGMNDSDYPRQQPRNSFDLMQYHRQKGDRLRREDDRYLFLEALLSAREQLYISYIGRSIVDNQPKEASVLVNQLLDYITERAGIGREALVVQHSMQIFSPKNFEKTHRSFARQWLPAAETRDAEAFIQTLPESERDVRQTPRIELSALIAFVQNPVKFFFEKRLGVYFKSDESEIEDHENFQLDQRELFLIRDELLNQPEHEISAYFERLKLKGVLPQGAFGKIYLEKVRSDLAEISALLAPYRQQGEQNRFVELDVGCAVIVGNINRIYGEGLQRVDWRAGRIREKDRIANSLSYFALQASSEQSVAPACFYGTQKAKGWVGEESKPVDKAAALAQLQIYAEAYLRGERRLCPVPAPKMGEYYALLKAAAQPDDNQCRALLERIAYEPHFQYMEEDPYWARLLAQSPQLDFTEINREFLRWFAVFFADE